MKANWRMVLVVAALLLISGCSKGSIPQATPSSTPTTTPTASNNSNAVYTQAAGHLQSFLTSWQKNGLYAAGQKYLDSSSRSNQRQGNPVLIAGTVANMQPYSWVSADHFTVMAGLDLQFSGGFSEGDGGWGSGANTLFITFVRSSASAPYQMTLASGP